MISRFIAAIGLLLALGASASAITETFVGTLDGLQENPDVPTSATGSGTAVYDSVANSLAVNLTFSGLGSNTNNAHIHCCSLPPVNTPVIIPFVPPFPLGVTSGVMNTVFNLTPATVAQVKEWVT